MTWVSRIHSPSIITMPYSMGSSIHMLGECIAGEQRRIEKSRILFLFFSPTFHKAVYKFKGGCPCRICHGFSSFPLNFANNVLNNKINNISKLSSMADQWQIKRKMFPYMRGSSKC